MRLDINEPNYGFTDEHFLTAVENLLEESKGLKICEVELEAFNNIIETHHLHVFDILTLVDWLATIPKVLIKNNNISTIKGYLTQNFAFLDKDNNQIWSTVDLHKTITVI